MTKSNKSRKFIATSATAALVASAIVPVASAAQINDFNSISQYAKEAVQDLNDRGVIKGDQKGNFNPLKSITRAEAATILTNALELDGTGSTTFADVKTSAWYYDAIDAAVANGIFQGQGNNKFNPSANLTRSEAAIILVDAFGLEGTADLSEFKDSASVKTWAKEALEIAVANGVMKGDAGNLKPNASISRQEFAVMYHRTEAVETTTPDASAVVPTDITFEQTSFQGNFGEKVTLKAKVAVAAGESAANIPVKFDVFHERYSNDTTIVPQLTETVVTDENGVATYTYTRSQGETDTVNAYAVNKPAKKAVAKVYWADNLAIKDVTEATTLANGEQKVYQITGEEDEVVYVAFKENINVAPEKAVRGVEFLGLKTTADTASAAASAKFAYEYTTGGYAVGVIKLDATGKANLVLTGTDAEVTPIVFVNNPGTNAKFDATALQATASKVKFEKESVYNLTLAAEGNQVSAFRKDDVEIGGRDYVATLKNKEGKAITNAKVQVTFEDPTTSDLETVKLYDVDGKEIKRTSADSATFELTTDKEGKAKFTVTQSVKDAFATPIVFLETGSKAGLDKKDIQATSEITYFRTVRAGEYTSKLIVTDESKSKDKETETFGSGKVATFTYQLSDQNGKARSAKEVTKNDTTVQFTVRADASPVTVVKADGTKVTVKAYSSASFSQDIANNATKTAITIEGDATNVRVTATATNTGLSGLSSVTKTAKFLSGASTSYFSIDDTTETTADSVTLTFTEAVNVNDIVVSGIAGATKGSDSKDNKVVYVYFNEPKLTAAHNKFSISYKGTTYNFVYDAKTGKVTNTN